MKLVASHKRPLLWRVQPLRWMVDAILGYDVFVSYAWRDGRLYALSLATALRNKGYRCFLDDSEMPGGSELASTVALALRRSSALVLVTTAQALESPHVEVEVRAFAEDGRYLVPVFLEPGLREHADGPTLSFLRRRVWLDDAAGSSAKKPSPAVLERLIQTFRFVRRTRLRTAALVAAALSFAAIAGVALLQLYRVETARRLNEAQVLSRTQPTEALLVLSEMNGRWLADHSLLPQISPALITAPLTVHRHIIGDAVYQVAWLPDGGYAAVSANGNAYVWNRHGRQVSVLPPRRASTPDERQGFGRGTVPLSRLVIGLGGKFIATVDRRNCLRMFSSFSASSTTAAETANNCLNRLEGEARGSVWAFSADGDLAIVRGGAVEFLSGPRAGSALPSGQDGEAAEAIVDGGGAVHIRLSNGGLLSLARSGALSRTEALSLALGMCSDGVAWAITAETSTTEGGNWFVRLNHEGTAVWKLAGPAPYLVSETCALYVDGSGDLYKLADPPVSLKRGLAPDWQKTAHAVQIAFSSSDRLIALSSYDGPIRVLDLEAGTERLLLGHTQRVFGMAFGRDDGALLTGSFDGAVRMFDLGTGLRVAAGRFPGSEAVYSGLPDGEAVVSAQAFEALEDLPPDQGLTVAALGAGGDTRPRTVRSDWRRGKQFYLADGDDKYVAVCSAFRCPDGSELRKLRLDFISGGSTVQARSSADGRFLAVVEEGRAFHVFDLTRGSDGPLLSIRDDEVRSVAFDGEGQRLFVLRGDRLFMMPFGSVAVDKAARTLVKFCLSKEEREVYFSEWSFFAARRAGKCFSSMSR